MELKQFFLIYIFLPTGKGMFLLFYFCLFYIYSSAMKNVNHIVQSTGVVQS